MSPESNSTTENRIVSGQDPAKTIPVPRPESGAEIAVASSPGGVLELAFDPSGATASRVDNNLVFELDGGGKVTVTDFFAVGDESLPGLRLPDGVEVASRDFFEGSDLDLTTAAGPAAGSPASGGTSYSDDGGNLLAGVDRYGMLGTDYWDRQTEPDIEARGVTVIGGSFDFGAITPGASGGGIGVFGGFVYEDGRPQQHQYGLADGQGPLAAGRLVGDITPNAGSSVQQISFWDFPEGTRVYLGDPAAGGTELSLPADGVYSFTLNEFNLTGVYIIPPENSDADFTVQASVTFSGAGASVTVNGQFLVEVDAVADRPEDFDAALSVTELQHATAGSTSEDQDGNIRSGEAANINLKLEAVFGDWEDGSERHFFDVNNIPTDWALNEESIPDGWKLVLKDADGNYREISYAEYQDYLQSLVESNGNGVYSLAFEVTVAATAGQGAVNEVISFNPGDWTSEGVTGQDGEPGDVGRWSDGSLNDGGPARLEISAVALETAAADNDYSNNLSIVSTTTVELSLTEDTPDIDYKHVLFTDEQAWGQQWTDKEHGDIKIWDNAWASYESPDPGSVGSIIKGALAQIGAQGNITLVEDNNLLSKGSDKSSPVLGASTTTITYDLKSDGLTDGEGGYGSQQGQAGLSIDLDGSDLPLFAKLPTDVGYSAIVYESYTDADGNVCIVGYIDNGDGARHVAVAITLQPGALDGTAALTVIQYLAYEHEFGKLNNQNTYGIKVVVTDDDGDERAVTVTYVAEDDTPQAANDTGVYDERVDASVGGNVLDNDNAKADGWAADGDKPGGVVGYTISVSDGAGQTYSIAVPDGQGGWTKVTTPDVGVTCTILDAKGNAQGEFSLQANGDWSFTRADGCDVIRDFDITVKYTAQDADGDNARAQLDVEVKAAPILVGVTGEKYAFESDTTGMGSVNDAPGVAVVHLTTYNYDGSVAQGDVLYEGVKVTLQISGSGDTAASLADFNLSQAALEAANPDLLAAGGSITFVSPDTIEATIPAGYEYEGSTGFPLNIPLSDDALGGYNTSSDGAEEGFTVEILSVTGVGADSDPGHYLQPDDARYDELDSISTESSGLIVDDGVVFNEATGQYEYADNRMDYSEDSGKTSYDHKTDEHPLDGPALRLGSPTSTAAEGGTVYVRLNGSYDPNTNAAYTSGTVSQEKMTIELQFTCKNGLTASDVNIYAANSASGLIYQYQNASGQWVTFTTGSAIPAAAFIDGAVTIRVEVPAGYALSDLASLGLKVGIVNDNLENEAGEGFTVAITGASGNECAYFGTATDTIVITDPHNNTLTLSGGDTQWEGGVFEYTFTLNTTAALKGTGTAVNTDPVTITVTLGGSATFGKDYTLADLQAANPKLSISLTGYDNDGNPILQITVNPDEWSNQNLSGNHSVSLNIPTVHDGQIGEADETISITINGVTGAEVGKVINNATDSTIMDRASLELHPTQGSSDIWEEGVSGKPTVATYEVKFLHDTGFGSDGVAGGLQDGALDTRVLTGEGDTAATTFTFDITLKDGTARFDSNMEDNWSRETGEGSDAKTGDYGWAVGGKLIEYGELAMSADFDADGNPLSNAAQDALIKAINDALVEQGFATYDLETETYSGIYVTDVSNNGRTLTFQVDEGSDLSTPLPIQVGAIDDRLTESNESYKVVLSNIQTEDGTHISIDRNQESTTIHDDDATTGRDGFLVGIEPGEGNESSKQIGLPIVLYERDENGLPVSVNPGNPPSQAITVSMDVGVQGDAATLNSDYYVNADGSYSVTVPTYYYVDGNNNNLPSGYTGAYWQYVEGPGDAPAHWLAVNVGIPLNDDRLTEGDESFTVTLTGVTGNESSLLDGDKTAQLTIHDDTLNKTEAGEDQRDGTPIKDGPGLASFTLNGGRLVEPEAADVAGDGTNNTSAGSPFTVGTYTIAMDAAAAEDIIVTVNLNAVGATEGADFTLVSDPASGSGLLSAGQLIAYYGGIENLPAYFTAFTAEGYDPAADTNYYAIIKEGSSSATFDIHILHDHDSSAKEGGLDSALDGTGESLTFTITDMVGSEVQWDGDTPDVSAGTHVIEDDMKGPWVTLDSASVTGGVLTGVIALEPAVAIGEEVQVTEVTFVGKNGTEISVSVSVNQDGGFTVTVPDAMLSQDYYYVRLSGYDQGGETRLDTSVGKPFYNGDGPGNSTPMYVTITANDIYEVNPANQAEADNPRSVTYDLAFTGLTNFDITNGAGFTIRTVNNTTSDDDFDGDTDVTIVLSKELLDELKGLKLDGFTVTIIPGEDGAPVQVLIYTSDDSTPWMALNVESGGSLTFEGGTCGSISGTLPTAYDDSRIEGDELFQPILVAGDDAAGWIRPAVTKPDQITIIDNDAPSVIVSFGYEDATGFHTVDDVAEGQMTHSSGNAYVVRVALPEGVELTDGYGPITVKLTLTVTDADGNEVLNADGDVTLFTQYVTLYPGDSLADVRVTFPDDFISDDGKTFTVSAEFVDQTRTESLGTDGITIDPALEAGVTIADTVNGPQISLSSSASSVGENSQVNFWVTLDKALEENAEVTMKINLATDGDDKYLNTADGFVLDDIASIKVNGGTYVIELDVPGDPTGGYTVYEIATDGSRTEVSGAASPLVLDAQGNILVTLGMADGSSKDGFTVVLNNDTITENKETLTVTVVGTEGGELIVPDNTFSNVTITDVRDGPTISLVQLAPEAQGGVEGETISIGISLSGKTDTTVSETTITLNLGDEVVSKVLGSGEIIVTDKDGAKVTGAATLDGNKVVITLPAGTQGPLTVTFPLQDNALEGENADKFVVSLSGEGVGSGECSIAGGRSYDSDFKTETDSSLTFVLTGATGALSSQAECVLNLSGVNMDHVATVTFTYNGTTYTLSGADFANGVYTLLDSEGNPVKSASSMAGVEVTVTFDTGAMTPAEIAAAKLNTAVSAGQSGQELSLTVLDDLASYDGPVFSVDAADDTGMFTEDSGVVFTIKAEQGDVTQQSGTQQPVTVTFTLDGDAVADPAGVTVALLVEGMFLTVSYNASDGTYSVTIPSGTAIPLELTVTVPTSSDSVVGTSADVTLTLTGVSGNEATLKEGGGTLTEIIGEDTGTAAALVFTQNAAAITEGESLSFTMSLRDASGQNMSATEALKVSFIVSLDAIIDWNNLAQGITHEPNLGGGDGWLVTVTLPAGSESMTVELPLDDVEGFQGDRSLTITGAFVEGETNHQLDGFISMGADSEVTLTYTVQDPTSFTLAEGASFDGSLSSHGLEIFGDGANEITGSEHNDVIHAGDDGSVIDAGAGDDILYAGRGVDTLSGGSGSDIFAWESGKLGGTDTILDFDFNYQWNQDGTTLTAISGESNDKIQLNFSELLGLDTEQSLDDLLAGLTQDGNTASFSVSGATGATFEATFLDEGQLRITLTGTDDTTLQTIMVNSANDFHDDLTNMSSDQAAMILQNILNNC